MLQSGRIRTDAVRRPFLNSFRRGRRHTAAAPCDFRFVEMPIDRAFGVISLFCTERACLGRQFHIMLLDHATSVK